MKNLTLVIAVLFVLFSCEKNENERITGNVTFSVDESVLLKNTSTCVSDIKKLVISIETVNGIMIYNLKTINLFKFNDGFLSEPVALKPGNYLLATFLVIDQNDSIIYLTPRESSELSYLVKSPLPVNFSVSKDETTKVGVEVISSSLGKSEDFGYATFSFNIVNLFNFLISVFVYNENTSNFEPTDAELTIKNNSEVVYQTNIQAKTNQIVLRKDIQSYILIIEKNGYTTISKLFSTDSLIQFENSPLMINLEPANDLVAYLKFNGDAKDYSSYNNSVTLFGTDFTTGLNDKPESAVELNGSSDYIVINNSDVLNPTNQISVCVWYFTAPFYGNGANSLITKRLNDDPSIVYTYHLATSGNTYTNNPSSFGFNVTTENGRYGVNVSGYGGGFEYIPFKYELYKWYFLVATYDGSMVKLYINGNLMAWQNASGKILASPNNIQIGNIEGTYRPYNDFTPGKIYEIRIYNRALTQEEILTLYNLE